MRSTRAALFVCIVIALVSGTRAADSFTDEMRFLEQQDVQNVGRDNQVAAYEQLLHDHPDHPDRAKAMLQLASLWQITNPELNIKPDPQMEIRWLREAYKAAHQGSSDWIESGFRLAGQIKEIQPDEARSTLREIMEHSPAADIQTRAIYLLQMIATEHGDLLEAERLCRSLQDWDISPEKLPKEMLKKGDVYSWIQSSASLMMMAWAGMRVPKAERVAKIEAFAQKYEARSYIQTSRDRAYEFLAKLPDDGLTSPLADELQQNSSIRNWLLFTNLAIVGVIVLLLGFRRMRRNLI